MSKDMIVILDYGMGNVRSVANALKKVNLLGVVSREKADISNARALIIPGVGAFRHGMDSLRKLNLIKQINRFVESGKPVLGICLGMQMLMEESDEYGSTPGIGLIPGKVKKLSLTITDQKRLPHIGWNTIHTNFNGCRDLSKTLFHGIKPEHSVYFLHSYAAYPSDKNNIL